MTDVQEESPPDVTSNRPSLIAKSVDIVGDGNFPQGCSFSPDGLCVLTTTASDRQLRLYNTPLMDQSESEVKDAVLWKTSLAAVGCDSVRSYAWFPQMNSSQAASCCFLASSRDQPIHLFDAYTGRVRATYCPYNALDEMESPGLVAFSPDGQHVYSSGFRTDRVLHVFDTVVPGRDSTVLRLGKTRRSSDGQKGLVSAIAFSPRTYNHVFCIGTYSPGSIYVYDERLPSGNPCGTVLQGVAIVGHGRGHVKKKQRFVVSDDDDENIFSAAKVRWFQTRARGGVTQLSFSPAEDYILYSASRRSDAVLAWDLRMVSGNEEYASTPIRGISSFATNNKTNQRLEFDFDEQGHRLFIGGLDKCVRIYDTTSGKLLQTLDGLADVANGVSFTAAPGSSPNTGLLAVTVGGRRFPEDSDEAEEEEGDDDDLNAVSAVPGSIELYRV